MLNPNFCWFKGSFVSPWVWTPGLHDPNLARHVLSELERWRDVGGPNGVETNGGSQMDGWFKFKSAIWWVNGGFLKWGVSQ
jgi:hypothetical protein